MNLPAIAPQYNKGFIIVKDREEIPEDTFFHFWFYATAHGFPPGDTKPGDFLVGQLFGHPYEDEEFNRKLNRWN